MRIALILAALFGLMFTAAPAAAQHPCATGAAIYGCDSSMYGRQPGRVNHPFGGNAYAGTYYGSGYGGGETLYLFGGRGSAYYRDITPRAGYYSPFGGKSEEASNDPFNCLLKEEVPPNNMPPPRYRRPSSHHRWCARLGEKGWYDADWYAIGKDYD